MPQVETTRDYFHHEAPETRDSVFDIRNVPPSLRIISDMLERWHNVDPVAEVTPEFCLNLVDDYIAYHNMDDDHAGAKAGHKIFANGLYPPDFLPGLTQAYQWAEKTDDQNVLAQASIALYILRDALDVIKHNTNGSGFKKRDAFATMRSRATDGDPEYQRFLTVMSLAREAAATCLFNEHLDTIPADEPIRLKKGSHAVFGEVLENAREEYLESQNGINLGPDFLHKLLDENTKIVFFVSDINGTWTIGDAYSCLPYVEKANSALKTLAYEFHRIFPDKTLHTPWSTGRPSDYLRAWGDANTRTAEVELGWAESGGVKVIRENHQIHTEVAIEHPAAWEKQLDGLREYIFKKIGTAVVWEPKKSMLSMRIANPEEGGEYLYEVTEEGVTTPVTEDWIQLQIDNYLDETERALKTERKELRTKLKELTPANEVIDNLLKRFTPLGPDGEMDTDDDISEEDVDAFDEAMQEVEGYRKGKITEINHDLKTVLLMKKQLNAKFNSAVGFVDIANKFQNKFTAIMREVEEMGLRRDQALIVMIGDSSVDIPPTTHTQRGQPNEGADGVYFIAVNDCTPEAYNAVEERAAFSWGSHLGIHARRPAILTVVDAANGMIEALQKCEPIQNAALQKTTIYANHEK